ncbi:hypothetical protein MLD38_018290 [Melastoma candidum]|uniref:Uncharacterized protein n=1 Tax=Melastoma candidum TaxID=119954 RepID=A0ACB9QTD6_9MYRT|nr:hypothetical protein MLD38_018290 [Melastoma candidum]
MATCNPNQHLFLNPSTTEALALGKLMVCANHPSDELFFKQFPTYRMYDTGKGSVEVMQKALSEEPGR